MNADLARLVFTYTIALFVTVGGMLEIYFLLQQGIISGDAGLAIIGPLVGAAIGFVFNRESTTAGQRSAERAINQGANAGVIPEAPKP